MSVHEYLPYANKFSHHRWAQVYQIVYLTRRVAWLGLEEEYFDLQNRVVKMAIDLPRGFTKSQKVVFAKLYIAVTDLKTPTIEWVNWSNELNKFCTKRLQQLTIFEWNRKGDQGRDMVLGKSF